MLQSEPVRYVNDLGKVRWQPRITNRPEDDEFRLRKYGHVDQWMVAGDSPVLYRSYLRALRVGNREIRKISDHRWVEV